MRKSVLGIMLFALVSCDQIETNLPSINSNEAIVTEDDIEKLMLPIAEKMITLEKMIMCYTIAEHIRFSDPADDAHEHWNKIKTPLFLSSLDRAIEVSEVMLKLPNEALGTAESRYRKYPGLMAGAIVFDNDEANELAQELKIQKDFTKALKEWNDRDCSTYRLIADAEQ